MIRIRVKVAVRVRVRVRVRFRGTSLEGLEQNRKGARSGLRSVSVLVLASA